MFCSKCGQENSNSARFCESCGGSLNSGAGHAIGAGKTSLAVDSIIKYKKPLIIGTVAIIAIWLLVSVFNQPQTPLSIAEKYLDEVADQDYAGAYEYLDPELNMPKSAYVYCMQEAEKKYGAVKEYRIENSELEKKMEESLATSYDRSYTVVLGRNKRDMKALHLKNISANEEPDWRVEPFDSYNMHEIRLGMLPELKVKVCGEEVKVDGEGKCTIVSFDNIDLPVEISSPSIVTKKFKYPSEADEAYSEYQVTDKLKVEIEKVLNGFFTSFTKAQAKNSVEEVAPYVVRNSEVWDDIERAISRGSLSGETITLKKVNNVTLNLNQGNPQIRAEVLADVRYQQGSPSSSTEYVSFIDENGTWKLIDIN